MVVAVMEESCGGGVGTAWFGGVGNEVGDGDGGMFVQVGEEMGEFGIEELALVFGEFQLAVRESCSLIDCGIVTSQGCERGKLSCTLVHGHAWMAAGRGVGK